ncbi:MAG: response regulator, partial [Spirochaetes bacterium]|nr:response regulator [Spirochaetota bacterium]
MNILAIDDEPLILECIKDYFDDYQIITINDPQKALTLTQKKYFDIIIADYRMPSMNGLELLMAAKKNSSYGYAIMLTAYADKTLLEQLINFNLISQIVEKPLDLEKLEVALKEV